MFRKFIIFSVFILLITNTINADSIKTYRTFDSLYFAENTEQLMIEYGQNLSCPNKYKLQTIIALSYYKELSNIPIEVKFSKIGTTASCRPKLGSIIPMFYIISFITFSLILLGFRKTKVLYKYPKLKHAFLIVGFLSVSFICYAHFTNSSKSDREYVININNKNEFEGILLKNVPFNAQIGIIGHEIGHIIDYENRNLWGIIGRAIDYIKDSSKKEFEYEIDCLTIEHGLGWQLYDWSDFAINKSNATAEYKEFKKKIYMSPAEIKTHIDKLSIYNETIK